MIKKILRKKLNYFNGTELDHLAKITFLCHAIQFVNETCDYDENCNLIRSYKFKGEFLTYNENYYVLCIPDTSYLIYEKNLEEIIIWVAYTEEKERRKGYIKYLLQSLVKQFPKRKKIIDTHETALKKLCNNLGIKIFRKNNK